MAVTWNITRAADEADALARELEAQGLRARSLPCIERFPLEWPEVPEEALLFLTSAAALPIPPQAARCKVAALSKVASQLALSACLFVASDGGVVALASALYDAWERSHPEQRARIVYPTSDQAQKQPEHLEAMARLARFADVSCTVVYRVAAPQQLVDAVRALPPDSGLVFFSPSAVENFLAACTPAPPAPRAVVVHGASTARAWDEQKPAGWPAAVAHGRDHPLADTLRRLS